MRRWLVLALLCCFRAAARQVPVAHVDLGLLNGIAICTISAMKALERSRFTVARLHLQTLLRDLSGQ